MTLTGSAVVTGHSPSGWLVSIEVSAQRLYLRQLTTRRMRGKLFVSP
eukprot:CAMPEP_0177765530 /NCGR_PEP_ID=MMETSP0491_2-20121128/8042_1 /TAXON_ID=63592 /ORGANISM="Tetraselmis chuii, Strain PLY429" /LENGTH=46 /DNA_ID= /DNA_START= /DNA_END= /DNA_ORIENTATION=